MKKILFTTLLLLFFVRTNIAHEEIYKFINANIFNGKDFEKKDFYAVNGSFEFEYSGKIDSIIDLQNSYIVPPFGDAHNHVIADGMDYKNQINTFLYHGIFYIKNPNNSAKLVEPIKPFVNIPVSVDIVYSNGGLTATGGHPIQIYKFIAGQNIFPGWTEKDMENQEYFIIDNENDLDLKWDLIKNDNPDFIKVYLEHSEEFEKRKNDTAYFGKKGLDPKLLPLIVAKAHKDYYKVSAHVNTPADFHNAVVAGVDEINHLPLGLIDDSDAAFAADKGIVVVTTTMSHRPLDGIKNINEIHWANLKLLNSKNVTIAIGTDNGDLTSLNEIENIKKLNVFDNLTLLKMLCEDTPTAIFSDKKIGYIKNGYECNFLALSENPLIDLTNVKQISMRVKRGHIINPEVVEKKKPSINDAIAHTLMSTGVGAAIEEYRKLKAEEGEVYDFSELQLNALGYELLKRNMFNEAIEIFKLNVEMFPESANVYDSLGEAYLKTGNKDLAIVNYQRSIELNPNNTGGKKILEELVSGK